MNLIRVERWKKELTESLQRQTSEQSSDSVIYLLTLMAEYIQRWIGFARMKEIGISGTLSTDSFCIILAAIEVVNSQLVINDKRKWFPIADWEKFENSIEYIQHYQTEDGLGLVIESFDQLRDAISNDGNHNMRQP